MLLALASLAPVLWPQAGPSAPPINETILDLEITLRSPPLGERGPSVSVGWTSDFSGTFFAWTESDGLDLFLQVEDESGDLLEKDEDGGGGKTPYVQREVEPGQTLSVRVAARPGEAGRFELHLNGARETRATRKAAADARKELEKIETTRQQGKPNLARRKIETLVRDLLPIVSSRSSHLSSEVLLDAGYRARDLGATRSAVEALRAVSDLWQRIRPSFHEGLQRVRASLAYDLERLGDHHGALTLREKVLETYIHTLPDDAPDLQSAQGWLAYMLESLGDYAGARLLREKVIEVRSRTLPDDHVDLQRARSALAHVLYESRDVEGARVLYQKVLEIQSRTLPADNRDLQLTRMNVASCLEDLGDLQTARTLKEGVLEAYSRTLPEDHDYLQRARTGLAWTLQELGELQQSRKLREEAIKVYYARLPDDHPELQTVRKGLVWTLALLGVRHGAQKLASELARATTAGLSGWMSASAPSELEVRAMRVVGVSTVLSLASGAGFFEPSPKLEQEAFELVESLRGLGLMSARLVRSTAQDPEASVLREQVMRCSEELAQQSRAGAAAQEIDGLRRQRDEVWRELIARVTAGRERDLLVQPTAEALARRRAPDHALVSWCRYSRIVKDPGDRKKTTETESLLAYVLRNDGTLRRVELGPVKPIEAAVELWREALGVGAHSRGIGVSVGDSGALDERSAGEALRLLVFDPLRSALGDCKRAVVALDDVLHLVPLDALPDGEETLGDHLAIEVRSSLQELLWPERPTMGDPVLVALGGARFEQAPQALARRSGEPEPPACPPHGNGYAALLRGSPCEAGFGFLDGTEAEARELAAIHSANLGNERNSLVLVGAQASREALEELAPRARYLHVATHGWFSAESVRSIADPEPLDAKLGFGRAMNPEEHVRGSSPMVLCGLALAGANLSPDGAGRVPGLLTGEEVASWDLSNCELAVLSACDTNVGVRRAGQGVASLQKALHMAGARSVITSLWKVPDEATKELMVGFYRRLWTEKKAKHQALWEAKKALREARDAGGQPLYSTRDWAAWVLTGSPR